MICLDLRVYLMLNL